MDICWIEDAQIVKISGVLAIDIIRKLLIDIPRVALIPCFAQARRNFLRKLRGTDRMNVI